MDSSNDGLPRRRLGADQLVAINIRRWRIAAGLTQEELGARVGWSVKVMSAAERSAAPSRDHRRFDARDLAGIARAIGVPLVALFLPPPDDGTAARYSVSAGDGEIGMAEWLDRLVIHDNDADTPVMRAYRSALAAGAYRYLDDAGWAAQVAGWLGRDSPQRRSARAEVLREHAEEMLRAQALAARAAAAFSEVADALEAGSGQ